MFLFATTLATLTPSESSLENRLLPTIMKLPDDILTHLNRYFTREEKLVFFSTCRAMNSRWKVIAYPDHKKYLAKHHNLTLICEEDQTYFMPIEKVIPMEVVRKNPMGVIINQLPLPADVLTAWYSHPHRRAVNKIHILNASSITTDSLQPLMTLFDPNQISYMGFYEEKKTLDNPSAENRVDWESMFRQVSLLPYRDPTHNHSAIPSKRDLPSLLAYTSLMCTNLTQFFWKSNWTGYDGGDNRIKRAPRKLRHLHSNYQPG